MKSVKDEPKAKWIRKDSEIIDEKRLKKIKELLQIDAVIVEHRSYFGAQSPTTQVFDNFDVFFEFFQSNVMPGDSLSIWIYSEVLTDEKMKVHGKVPDDDGFVPETGYY